MFIRDANSNLSLDEYRCRHQGEFRIADAVAKLPEQTIEQTFTGKEGLAAVGWVKGLLRGPGGNLDPQKVLEAVSPGAVSPPMPEAIAAWNALTREKLQGGNG